MDFSNKLQEELFFLGEMFEPAIRIMQDERIERAFRSKNVLQAAKIALMEHTEDAAMIVACSENKKPDEMSDDKVTLLLKLYKLCTKKEMLEVFGWQGQKPDETSSGSVITPTEASAQ